MLILIILNKKTENIKGEGEARATLPLPLISADYISFSLFCSFATVPIIARSAQSNRPIDHRKLFLPIYHPQSIRRYVSFIGFC